MADLNPLIRVRKHAVEQKRKFLADLYRQAEEMEAEKQRLAAELESERQKLDEALSPEALSYFGPYSEAVKRKIAKIGKEQAKLETRIRIAQEDMRAAFAELKKIEITQGRREQAEAKERAKKEKQELDEIAIENHRRKDDGKKR